MAENTGAWEDDLIADRDQWVERCCQAEAERAACGRELSTAHGEIERLRDTLAMVIGLPGFQRRHPNFAEGIRRLIVPASPFEGPPANTQEGPRSDLKAPANEPMNWA